MEFISFMRSSNCTKSTHSFFTIDFFECITTLDKNKLINDATAFVEIFHPFFFRYLLLKNTVNGVNFIDYYDY